MAEYFNIRNSNWNLSYLFCSTYNDTLLEIADFFYLKLLFPVQQVLTQYSDNVKNTNSVIDLIFLHPNSIEINNYYILSKLYIH